MRDGQSVARNVSGALGFGALERADACPDDLADPLCIALKFRVSLVRFRPWPPLFPRHSAIFGVPNPRVRVPERSMLQACY